MKNLEVINNEVYARPSREDYEYEFNEVIRIIKNTKKLSAAAKQQFLNLFNALHETQIDILDNSEDSICLTPYFTVKINYSLGKL
jgi:hypothetical protein